MINAFADIYGSIGLAIHSREFFMALHQLTPLTLFPKQGKIPENPNELLLDMLGGLLDVNLKNMVINFDINIDLARCSGRKKIAYTVFENTVLSPITLNILNQFDAIWVPSLWGKEVLQQNRIRPTVAVIHGGVRSDFYSPDITKTRTKNFVSVGKWEERKNFLQLIQAFDLAFADLPVTDVRLILHVGSGIHELNKLDIPSEIQKLNLKYPERLLINTAHNYSDQEMLNLYQTALAYVSTSRAEGWGLPLVEAMSCECPVIAPFYSAPTEYLTPDNSFLFHPQNLVDVYCPYFFQNKGSHGVWASYATHEIAEKLRYVYDHPDVALTKAKQARQDMVTKFSWPHAAQKAYAELRPYL